MKFFSLFLIIFLVFCTFHICRENSAGKEPPNIPAPDASLEQTGINALMDTMITDGFDYPYGNPDGKGGYTSSWNGKYYNSWMITTLFNEKYIYGFHPGVDVAGSGGGFTDFGQPVYSSAKGIVLDAADYGPPWGKVVTILHKYLENGLIKSCYSLYVHLDTTFVVKGNFVQKRTRLGTIGTGGGRYVPHLHFEVRKENMEEYEPNYWPGNEMRDDAWIKEHYEDPVSFISSHRKTTCPQSENRIIIVIKSKYVLYYFKKGRLTREYEIALSQEPEGRKEKTGDLKMPEGEYFVTGKAKGPFYGDYSEFLGNRYISLSYPNRYDADSGYRKGLITKEERNEIISADRKKMIPPQLTPLGGKIVIHGWYGEWSSNGPRDLTWGCISMHNSDIEEFYDMVALNTTVIIQP